MKLTDCQIGIRVEVFIPASSACAGTKQEAGNIVGLPYKNSTNNMSYCQVNIDGKIRSLPLIRLRICQ
jgi:hypothetical protein